MAGVLQEELLLLQLGDELSPAKLDRVVALGSAVKESDLKTGIWVLR